MKREYSSGTSEDVMPVGNGNFIASKFTPDGYPSDLYASSFYVAGSQTGISPLLCAGVWCPGRGVDLP